ATIDAGEIAGLSVTRIVNEPTAAALAYGLDKTDQDMKILVFSFGGGTNDTTIMDFGSGVFEVLSTSGDTQTGGADVDKAVMDYLIAEFKGKTGIDLTSDMKAMARLKEAAEKAKIELSNLITTEIELPYIAMNADGPQNLQITLTRAKLEQIAASIVERIIEPIRRTIRDSGLTVDKIDKLVLFGGMTKMPLVQKTVEELVGKKMERGIDPMECVAIGASIQGAVLAGEIDDIVLLDVTPLSLGVETMGAVMTKVLDRNTTIPTKQTKVFSTAADMQTAVTINVLQGERSMAADNINLGSFNLAGIPAAPRGVPQIEVTFDINADGVLNVSAKDLGTSKEMSITIQAATKLSDAEKDRMVREAEQYADADKEAKEAAEIKNQADTLVYSTEKLLNEQSEKIPAEMREKIMEPLEALKTAVQEGSTAEIKSKMEDLEKVAQELGASLYQQAGDQAAAGGPGGPQPGPQPEQQQDPGKKTVEADYKVVDEDEKE
ncbi:molecular chaperone DnaK, partial [Candidatus Bathyarchaeota archaeon]|nr:molecular chaperone DnaK [Candidatus Bathyarchaeota archaeon]